MTDKNPNDTANILGGEPEKVGYKHPPKSGQFRKGYDPRRHLAGVPKEAIAARHFIRKIGAELLRVKEKQENGEVVEYDVTRAEALVRLMFSSKAPKDKETLMKALWPGLLKEEVDLTSAGEKITWSQFIANTEPDSK